MAQIPAPTLPLARLLAALALLLAVVTPVSAALLPTPNGLETGPSPAAVGSGPEFAILDEYLRQFDRHPNLPHCARVGGPEATEDMPDLPVDRLNGTNILLDDHMAWHTYHSRLQESGDPADDENHYGEDFVAMHRHMVADYDAWRVDHGYPMVAAWDPASPIPPEFAYAAPTACLPRNSDDPQVRLPAWLTVLGGNETSPIFGYTSLCQFPSLNRLGKELDEGAQHAMLEGTGAVIQEGHPNYHGQVHGSLNGGGVGGDMATAPVSMRDPVFWAWHKYLDSRVLLWEEHCACPGVGDVDTEGKPEAPEGHAHLEAVACPTAEQAQAHAAQQEAPGLAPGWLAGLLGAMLLLRRRAQ